VLADDLEPDGTGRPTHCLEPVTWVGNHHRVGGKRLRVWSYEGHLEGVDGVRPTRNLGRARVLRVSEGQVMDLQDQVPVT